MTEEVRRLSNLDENLFKYVASITQMPKDIIVLVGFLSFDPRFK
jgi:hypothetical protein